MTLVFWLTIFFSAIFGFVDFGMYWRKTGDWWWVIAIVLSMLVMLWGGYHVNLEVHRLWL